MTTEHDINLFKRDYCCNTHGRKKMLVDFQVSVESFEELLLGQYIKSYATGERKVGNTFMILNVFDVTTNKTYYPVFSERVARDMLRDSCVKIPRKITIFSSEKLLSDDLFKENRNTNNSNIARTKANRALMHLIELVRAFMLLGVNNPQPMNNVFKSIYDGLIIYPNRDPFPFKIKSINTALGNYIKSHEYNSGLHSLNDFIVYVQKMHGSKRLKEFNFEILRSMFRKEYPEEVLYF